MILPKYGELSKIEEDIKREKTLFDAQKQKYENYQRALNQYKNRQKELDSRINRRDKIKNKLLNFSLNLKQRDFRKEMDDIETKINQLLKEKKQH